ncbi:hypothetical protein [Aliiroseovarius sp. YM-037]|uniref:hypothetical protein n=1 Tax=Aliiroseovarius sp. YM-037 TaxID=3341728 RepID=UPI003A810E9E
MPVLRTLILAMATMTHATVADADWAEVGQNIWINGGDQVAEVDFAAVRFKPNAVNLSLLEMNSFLNRRFSTAAGLRINTTTGSSKSIAYSLREVWELVGDDPNVVAVVPVGYLESAGRPQIAGFMRLRDQDQNPLMSAPNLTALYCLDNDAWRERQGRTKEDSGQIPYLFAVDFAPGSAFRYLPSLTTLNEEGRSDGRISGDLDSCENVVQIGPRIIDPRRLSVEVSPRNRVALDVIKDDRPPQPRVVVSWDLTGHLTFTIIAKPVNLRSVAEMVADAGFYGTTDACSQDADPDNRSASCEYWAAALTSFEHAGMIIRDGADAEPQIVGQVDTMIPAAIVVRRLQ